MQSCNHWTIREVPQTTNSLKFTIKDKKKPEGIEPTEPKAYIKLRRWYSFFSFVLSFSLKCSYFLKVGYILFTQYIHSLMISTSYRPLKSLILILLLPNIYLRYCWDFKLKTKVKTRSLKFSKSASSWLNSCNRTKILSRFLLLWLLQFFCAINLTHFFRLMCFLKHNPHYNFVVLKNFERFSLLLNKHNSSVYCCCC